MTVRVPTLPEPAVPGPRIVRTVKGRNREAEPSPVAEGWRPLAFAGLAVGLAVGLFVGGAWGGTYTSDGRVVLVATGSIAAIVWLIAALRRPGLRPSSALFGAFAVALGVLTISAAGAVHPRLATDFLAYAVLLTALYLLLVQIWRDQGLATRLAGLVAILAGLVSTLYIGQVVLRWVAIWQALGGLVMPPLRPGYAGLWLDNPNAVASLVVLLFVTSAAGIGWSTARARGIVGGLGGLALVAVLLSGSRGAWLGLVIAGIAVAGIWVVSPSRRRTLVDTTRATRTRAGALATAVIAIGALLLFAPAISGRLAEGGADVRSAFWSASVRMFTDRPITGLGPGSWPAAREAFTAAAEPDVFVPHAHNLVLQVAAELGVVGLVGGALIAVIVVLLVRDGFRSSTPLTRRYGWAVLVAGGFLLGQHLVDMYTHQPAILIAAALPLARLDALVTAERASVGVAPPRRLLTVVLLAALVASTVFALLPEPAARAQERAVEATTRGDWAAAVDDSRLAASDALIAPQALLYGLVAAHQGDLATAETQFSRVATQDDFPAAWLNLGAVRRERGNLAGAAVALDRATRLGIQQPSIAVAGARLASLLGDTDQARALLASAFLRAPSLASDPSWSRPEWRDVAPGALEQAREAAGNSWAGLKLALETGDERGATALATGLGDVASLAVAAWHGDDAAWAALHSRARATPFDETLSGICRRVALERRSVRGTDDSCSDVPVTDSYPIVRLGTPTGRQPIRGPSADFRAPYAYRRLNVSNLVVSWLPDVTAFTP